jgi:peptidoglycan/xylan/chitin deacetylase (PgdA/CDA1 family)
MFRFASLLQNSPVALPASDGRCAALENRSLPDVLDRERRANRARWRADLGSRLASIPSTLFGPCQTGVALLTYHRLAPIAPGRSASYNVTPARFEEQLSGLLARGYRARSLSSVVAAGKADDADLRRSFVVTFDDGYENFYAHALPILRRLRVPATLFPATAYLDSDSPFPFDADFAQAPASDAAELWRPMKSEQLREIVADPLIGVGSHTHTHQDFRNRPDDFEQDVRTSIEILTKRFGAKTPLPFSFPYGVASLGFTNGDLIRRTRQLPLTCALSTEPRLAVPGQDPFVWGRFDVKPFDTPATLGGKIDGWFTWLKRRAGLGPIAPASG